MQLCMYLSKTGLVYFGIRVRLRRLMVIPMRLWMLSLKQELYDFFVYYDTAAIQHGKLCDESVLVVTHLKQCCQTSVTPNGWYNYKKISLIMNGTSICNHRELKWLTYTHILQTQFIVSGIMIKLCHMSYHTIQSHFIISHYIILYSIILK